MDTLDISKRLKEAGFSEVQAEAVTTVLRDVREADLAPLATKADIERLEAKVGTDVGRLEAKLETQLELLRRDMTVRLGGMIIVATGIPLAAKFFG
ncbi:MAG TPA: hypothetical protein VKQ73_16985 [Stellaceae bacterium]|nr:hypothetical protein [Stellaceae bacterium]